MHIIITEPTDFPTDALAQLNGVGRVTIGPFTRESLKGAIADADVLIVRLGHLIDDEILAVAPKLKFIVTATTGLNHVDVMSAEGRGIRVLSLRGETEFLKTISPTAELTMGLILSLIRHIPAAVAAVNTGAWNRDDFKGQDLEGKTLGLFGYGRIGRKVARMATAFGMTVLAYDLVTDNPDPNAVFVSEEELLRRADILSIHVLHTEKTDRIFGVRQFAMMKKGALFINTARGEVIDEDNLLKNLQSSHIGGAALDVVTDEYSGQANWMEMSPLIAYARQNSNLIITPHIGGASIDAMAKVERFMVARLLEYIGTGTS